MISNVKVKGRKVSFDCSQEEHDILFQMGLQLLIDEHCGKRKVVVVPHGQWIKGKGHKTIEVSDEFSQWCVERAFNQALREYIDRMENLAAFRKWGKSKFDKRTRIAFLVNGFGKVKKGDVVHWIDLNCKIFCGAEKVDFAGTEWEGVTCKDCLALKGKKPYGKRTKPVLS